MSDTKDGGPAYPAGIVRKSRQRPHDAGSDFIVSDYTEPTHPGMSLRDWFAGQALAGIGLAAMQNYQDPLKWAKEAYDLADAMLKAREQSK